MHKEESKEEIIDTIETEFIKQKPERLARVMPEITGRSMTGIKKSNRNLYSTQLSSTISSVLKTDAMSSDLLVLGIAVLLLDLHFFCFYVKGCLTQGNLCLSEDYIVTLALQHMHEIS